MTGLLKDVMREQADGQAPPVVDVDAVVAAGSRRVRRARVATGSMALAAVAVGAFTFPHLVDGVRTTGADAPVAGQGREAVETFAERRVTYAVDHVIRYGETLVDVGRRITSFVQTDDGFVYTTRNGDVWLHDGTGSERVGHSENRRLRADDSGPLVAWVDLADDGAPQYVVFDTSSRTEVARVDDAAAGPSREPEDQGAEVFAVDDAAVYWRTQGGPVRYDLATGDVELLTRPAPVTGPASESAQVSRIVDVADGTIAYVAEAEQGSRMLVGKAIGDAARQLPSVWSGYAALSPDGRYLGVESDDAGVYDTATAADVTPALSRYTHRVAYGWVDDDTAMVAGVKDVEGETFSVDFLACDVPDGECTVVSATRVGQLGLVVPDGNPAT